MIKRLFKKKEKIVKSSKFNIATSKYDINPETGKIERIKI